MPVRDPTNKWYTSFEMYKDQRYPPYLQGGAYLMTRQTALLIWNKALITPLLHQEDVFITGILPKLFGLQPKGSSTFYSTSSSSYWGRRYARVPDCKLAYYTSFRGLKSNQIIDLYEKNLKGAPCPITKLPDYDTCETLNNNDAPYKVISYKRVKH